MQIKINQSAPTGIKINPASVSSILVNQGTPAANWYDGAISAWQFVGAASYSDAKTNLANPGTYDLTDIIAPSWTSTDGLIFTGSESLDTNLFPVCDGTWSMLIRYSDISAAADGVLAGLLTGYRFMVNAINDGTFNVQHGTSFLNVSAGTSGVIGFSGKTAYYNSTDMGTIPAGSTGTSPQSLLVGDWRVTNLKLPSGKIQAIGIWDYTLTPTEAATNSAAMAAL